MDPVRLPVALVLCGRSGLRVTFDALQATSADCRPLLRYGGEMGFHLWIAGDVAWAQGSYEYRPMGAAIVSITDLFKRRDFSARRPPPRPGTAAYIGQFASLGHLNGELRERRRASRNRHGGG